MKEQGRREKEMKEEELGREWRWRKGVGGEGEEEEVEGRGGRERR